MRYVDFIRPIPAGKFALCKGVFSLYAWDLSSMNFHQFMFLSKGHE